MAHLAEAGTRLAVASSALRRARALMAERRAAAALRRYREAARQGADPDAIAGEYWSCCMLVGAFAEAWAISDGVLRRRPAEDYGAHLPRHRRAVWDGRRLDGKHVLLRCFHGLGDTIQFIRYAPLLRDVVASLTVEAPAELLPLLAGAPGIDRLVPLTAGAPDPAHEAAIEAMEVPHALRTGFADMPRAVPYLRAAPARVTAWRRALGCGDRLTVGVAWAAGDWDPRRAVPLAALAELGSVPGLALVCLQRGPAVAELGGDAAPRFAVTDEAPAAIDETAALIGAVDLVVSVDTMVAHLAGALGKPVSTLLHFAADWRWMVRRADSPWYPTMRLYRQRRPGDWGLPVARLCRRLAAAAAQRPRSMVR